MFFPFPGPGRATYIVVGGGGGLADGDSVSSWTDSSVNGNNATQSGSVRPTFKTNIVNGKPVVRFTSTGLSSLNVPTMTSDGPWTAFAVVKATSGLGVVTLCNSTNPTWPAALLLDITSSKVWAHSKVDYGWAPFAGVGAFHVYTVNYIPGVGYWIRADGTGLPPTVAADAVSFDFNSIGKAGTWLSDGDIAELVFYYHQFYTIDEASAANIEKYLGTKYGITVAGGTAVDPSTVSGLVGWWKADSLLPASTGLSDGDPVSTWPDSSTGGHNATQTGSARPIFKTNIINGKPVVRFNAASAQFLNLPTGLSVTAGVTIFTVMQAAGTNQSSLIVPNAATSVGSFGPHLGSDSNNYVSNFNGSVGTFGTRDVAFHVLCLINGPPNLYVDGVILSAFSTVAINPTNLLTSIGRDDSTGNIAEIIIYGPSIQLGATDRANIEKYLGVKYGITVAGGSAVQPDTVAGLQGWWKADSLLPPVAALTDGDPVSLWPDSNFRGHDATQTGTARPTFKTNIVNGKPVVRFSSASSQFLNLTTPIASDAPWSVFAVMKQAASGDNMLSVGGDQTYATDVNASGLVIAHDKTGYTFVTNSAVAAFAVFTTEAAVTGSNKFIWINGASIGFGNTADARTDNFTYLGYVTAGGSPLYSNGDIAEIIIYNSVLGTTDRQNIEKYLGTKYGITVAGGSAVQPDTVSGLAGWWKADSLASTPFDPTTIAGLKLWLKADAIAITNGATVLTWNDSSANGYNLTGHTGTPTYNTNVVNGHAVVRFNGSTGDTLNTASNIGVSQPNTIIIVARAVVAADTRFIQSGGVQIVGTDGSGHMFIYAGTVIAGTVNVTGAFHVFTGLFAGGVFSQGLVDGVLQVGPGDTGNSSVLNVTLMSSSGATAVADIAEILIYNTALSTTDRQNVENYLKTKYAIT